MTTQLVKIEPAQLDEVIKTSGLQLQEGDEIKKSYLPFLVALSEIQSQATKINFDAPVEIDETIARELRLKTIKIRTGSKDLKDERKRSYLLRGNLEQAAYNLIESSCKLIEDEFNKVEKAREIAEKKRKETLRLERTEKLQQFTQDDLSLYPLGEMSNDQFTALFDGIKSMYDKKIEAERKVEEEKIAKEKAEVEEREKMRLENERLKKEAEAREKQIAAEKEKARIEQVKKDAEIEAERLRVKKENEEKERLAEIERQKQAKILADQKTKAEKEKNELLAKAETERKEKERLAKEIEDKKLADEKAKKELLEKLETEKKTRLSEEKKAKLAPDKTKLLNLMQAINDLPRPEVKSVKAAEILSQVNGLLVKVSNFIIERTNKL